MPLRQALALVCSLLVLPAAALTFNPGGSPPYSSAILVEAETGAVLYAHEPHLQRAPASTIKILLELVVMDRVAEGRLSLQDSIRVSAHASRIGGSQVYLAEGEVFRLEELMEAIALPSANDACVAVAEHMAGSDGAFAQLMNQKARDLGLQNTYCVNVHGLDDTPDNNRNLSTAYDLAQIARALIHHPKALEWSATTHKPFRNGQFMLYNTNKRLLTRFPGMDGLKTGYTRRAGSCLVATAQRSEMRLIAVVMGAPSERARESAIQEMLSWGFANFARVPVARSGELLGKVALDWGLEPAVGALAQDTMVAVLTPEQEKRLVRQLELPSLHPAPVQQGQALGNLRISLGDSLLAQVPVIAEKSIGRMGLWDKLMSYF